MVTVSASMLLLWAKVHILLDWHYCSPHTVVLWSELRFLLENAGLTPVVCFRGQSQSLLRHLGTVPSLETALRTVFQVNLTAQSISVYGCSVSASSLHVGSYN